MTFRNTSITLQKRELASRTFENLANLSKIFNLFKVLQSKTLTEIVGNDCLSSIIVKWTSER